MMVLKHNPHWTDGTPSPILPSRKRATRRELQKPQLDSLIGAIMYLAVFVVLMLVALPLLSLRYGVDSRHFSTRERRTNW
jgi:hypothetical protein